jgi:hypothetical protein
MLDNVSLGQKQLNLLRRFNVMFGDFVLFEFPLVIKLRDLRNQAQV